MTRGWSIRSYLTKAKFRQATFLTLFLTFSLHAHTAISDTPFNPNDDPIYKQRVSEVTKYIRAQALAGTSVLPSEVRQAMGWVSGTWHPLSALEDLYNGEDETTPDPVATNLVESIGAPSQADHTSAWHVVANLHHKGFLPTHDTAVIGMGWDRSLFDDKLQLTLRPFYGQNWRSLQGYYGGEIAMNIAKRPDGMPWGKMTIGYVGGNGDLTDHGTGIDLHGDVDLTHNIQFTSGIRQNSSDGDSNYMLVRWKMAFDP